MGTSASSLRASAATGTKVHRPLSVVYPSLSEPTDKSKDTGTVVGSRDETAPMTSSSTSTPEQRSERDKANDDLDSFNHPRLRRLLILQSLRAESLHPYPIQFEETRDGHPETDSASTDEGGEPPNVEVEDWRTFYEDTHSKGLLSFLDSAWDKWEAMGEEGRDPSGMSPTWKPPTLSETTTSTSESTYVPSSIPPLVPTNSALARYNNQKPSKHVLGQIGYYCTDIVTPIFADLKMELQRDARVMNRVLQLLLLMEQQQQQHDNEAITATTTPEPPPSAAATSTTSASPPVIYALPTHPGHHAAYDSFGGYCYVNHVAALAHNLSKLSHRRVAILDVDYHCGNGTASIFDDRPDVLVVSIHCHPDYDYPFHSGYADDIGTDDGKGTTLHLPLLPGTDWTIYERALKRGLAKIRSFDATICLVSLGLDTHLNDPCAIRRAGFALAGDDYVKLGKTIAQHLPGVPLVFVQEGGYRLDTVGEAAASVVLGCCSEP